MTAYAKELLDQFTKSGHMPPLESMDNPYLFEKYEDKWSAFIHEEADIYELLDIYKTERDLYPADPTALVVVTCGWAAPLGENGEVQGAPSKHRDRVRVLMATLIEKNGGLVTQLEMHKPEGVTYLHDYGSATGSLAEAMNLLGLCVWGRAWSQQMLMEYALASGSDTPYSEEVSEGITARLEQMTKALGFLAEEYPREEW